MMLPSIFEYCPDAITKLAEDRVPEREGSPIGRAAKTIGAGLLGLTGGTVLGYGAGRLAEKIHGAPLPPQVVAPLSGLAGAGLGVTYGLYKAQEMEELRRVVDSQRNKSSGGVPK